MKVQRDFPNCKKYDPCCKSKKSTKFWKDLQERVKITKPRKQPFRILTVKSNVGKAPEGFEGW